MKIKENVFGKTFKKVNRPVFILFVLLATFSLILSGKMIKEGTINKNRTYIAKSEEKDEKKSESQKDNSSKQNKSQTYKDKKALEEDVKNQETKAKSSEKEYEGYVVTFVSDEARQKASSNKEYSLKNLEYTKNVATADSVEQILR